MTKEPSTKYSKNNTPRPSFDLKKFYELSYKAMLKHKRMHNSPVVVSRDGKIVELNPHELPDELD